MAQTWKQRYHQEVEMMTEFYEKLNNRVVTVIRKVTPEEIASYEQIIKTNNYLLRILKDKGAL